VVLGFLLRMVNSSFKMTKGITIPGMVTILLMHLDLWVNRLIKLVLRRTFEFLGMSKMIEEDLINNGINLRPIKIKICLKILITTLIRTAKSNPAMALTVKMIIINPLERKEVCHLTTLQVGTSMLWTQPTHTLNKLPRNQTTAKLSKDLVSHRLLKGNSSNLGHSYYAKMLLLDLSLRFQQVIKILGMRKIHLRNLFYRQ